MTSTATLERTLAEWVDTPSISGDEALFLEQLEAYIAHRGWHTSRQPVADGRWNLLVAANPETSPDIVYSTHVDTVPPHIPFRREGDKLFGRGSCDTKGGMLTQVTAATHLRDHHARGDHLGMLFVVGEEVDHCGAVKARELPWRPAHILLCEPTRGRLITGQKGVLKAVLETHGVAAHSAFPHRGHSAVEPLLDALERIRKHPWPVDDTLGPTTLNIGLLSAGVAANVFAPEACAHLMFRLVCDSQQVIDVLNAHAGEATVTLQTRDEPQRLFVPPAHEGVAWSTGIAAFNSDAAQLSALGQVTLGGPGDIELAHSDNEHITQTELAEGVEMYTRLGQQLLDSLSD